MSVPALTVPGTTVNVPGTPVTVTTPTVRVPSTATTPPPAPKVTAPKAPSAAPVLKPVVKPVTNPVTNVVKKAVPKTTGTVTKTVPKATNTIKKATGDTTKTITNTGSPAKSGRPSGPSGPVDTLLGNVTGSLGGTTRTATGTVTNSSGLATSGAGAQAGSGSVVNGSNGMTFLGGPGGMSGGGSSGGGGSFPGGGSAATGGGSLAAMLVGASPRQLRNVLAHLEGCLPALPAIDRQVISMRAGVNGTPLTRPQIGAQLGMSRQAVRQTERRALNRLQYAAANTGCAGTLVGPFDASGIGNLTPQLLFAGAVPVNGSTAALTSGSDDFAQARGILPRTVSPLFDIGGDGQSGPAWAIILFTILFSVGIAALTRELRNSF